MIDHAVLHRERAHARAIAREGGPVGSAAGRELDEEVGNLRGRVHRMAIALVVVFDGCRRAAALQ